MSGLNKSRNLNDKEGILMVINQLDTTITNYLKKYPNVTKEQYQKAVKMFPLYVQRYVEFQRIKNPDNYEMDIDTGEIFPTRDFSMPTKLPPNFMI